MGKQGVGSGSMAKGGQRQSTRRRCPPASGGKVAKGGARGGGRGGALRRTAQRIALEDGSRHHIEHQLHILAHQLAAAHVEGEALRRLVQISLQGLL